ncbi:class I SAM-dependent methyltransferase [Desulfobulbus alkaliphilus]|uniref:class I SAM-dependent methyltransferase n=1 Tax=Desulfobulbus alkaliphilus TaxID=869814 RepID=UPI0019664535|nr:class I SAM-dependent methyltransferase [Desulfobulbus alkaliphilus]MBM9538375.1 class I SAM-dependent methyltransferase [Desulfobulbus alkaliphilus]
MSDFNLKAKGWDTDPVKIDRARAVARGIRAILPRQPGQSALEYGCGTGLLSFALQPFPGFITLADSSAGMHQVLADKIKAAGVGNMLPLRLDLTTDAVPARRFSLLYTLMTLHHIIDTEKILGQFHELLYPGGILCVADLDREDGTFHGPGFKGHPGFDRHELAEKTMAAGFAPPAFSTVFNLTRETGKVKKHYPLFLMTTVRPPSH